MKKIKLIKSVVVGAGVATLIMALPATSFAGDPQAGKAKSATCAACHGPDGNSQIPQNPSLAGQYEDYLVHSLKEYKSGERKNPIMGGMAAALSDEDIADLAAWFASQKGLNILPNDSM